MTKIEIKSLLKPERLYLFLIVVFGFILYLYVLTRYALVYGVDGPYYLIQVRSILETGRLKYDDPPLALYIFTFFALLFGGNITLGIKVGTALFSALSAAPLYFWTKKAAKSQLCGYLAALACIISSLHLLLMNNYLKMVVGTFFLLCFIYYLHCIIAEKGNIHTLLMAVIFLVLTGATHAIVFLVAFLFLALYAIVFRLTWTIEKEITRNLEVLLFMAFFFIIIGPLFLPFFFKDYYQALDLAISPFYRFRPPTVTSSDVISRFLLDYMSGATVLAAIIFGIILVVYEWRTGRKEAVLALVPVTVVGILLLTPFIPIEWVWRFLYMEFITIAFVLGYGFSKIPRKNVILAAALFLCFSPIIMQTVNASKTMMPTIREADYREIEEMGQYIPPNSVIFANPLYSYWIEYVTRTDTTFMFSPAIWQYRHVLILIDKLFPPTTTPNGTIIFEGRRFTLYEIEMRLP
ncbi:MAG: hypothetical protein RMJ15_02685 [Nitrososphaerota archaeon]|nr:hypothetical protein [Candidatus Bathyarchaeota archaeon]MDW8022637.1 hypothetical protein [Nitrososphaerota archaeon]